MQSMSIAAAQASGRGFSLLEVLVALVILSLGLLGLAGLQLRSLQASNDSFARTQAMILAYSIADRMRANQKGARDGDYAVDPQKLPDMPDYDCETTFPSGASSCDADALATLDTAAWAKSLSGSSTLPLGTGRVACADSDTDDGLDCTENSVYTITVMWDEQRTGSTGTGCSGDPKKDRQCMSIEVVL